MDNKKEKDNDKEQEKRKKRIKRIIEVIIIIIIILLLITSCTSKFWGKIGDLFVNRGEYSAEPSNNDGEIVLNKDLIFDVETMEMALSDEDGKLSFYYYNIMPETFTCYTSDAQIATCYVDDEHIVIKAKTAGKVDVTLETKSNGKTYQAKASVTITGSVASLTLSKTKGTINLNDTKVLNVAYELENIDGTVNVSVEDEKVASAKASDGVLNITGKAVGTTEVVLSVTNKGKEYTANYEITVIDSETGTSSNTGTSNTGTGTSTGGTSSNTKPVGGTSSAKPSKQSTSVNKKSNDSLLKSLTASKGTIDFKSNTYSYYLGFSNDQSKLTLNAVPRSSKAKVSYKYNGKTVSSLEDLELQVGNNELVIEVTAENGSKTTYKVTINRAEKPKSKDSSLSGLSVKYGKLNPGFNKNILDYEVKLGTEYTKESIYYNLSSKDAKVTLKYKGQVVSSLEDLDLTLGSNIVEIVVESAGGTTRTYTINIKVEKSTNNNLKDLRIDNKTISKFNSYIEEYYVRVPFDQESFTLGAVVDDGKSKVTYKYNGEVVTDLSNLPLNQGANDIEITVESESGDKKTYYVEVYRVIRTIAIDNLEYTFLAQTKHNIIYTVYEDGHAISDFDYDDIEVELNDIDSYNFEMHKNVVTVTPETDLVGTTNELTLTYDGYVTDTQINVYSKDHYVSTDKNELDLHVAGDKLSRDFVLHTDFFPSGHVKAKEIPGGLRIYDEEHPDTYIDVTVDNPKAHLEFTGGSDDLSFTLTVDSDYEGDIDIHVEGTYRGIPVNGFDILVHVKQYYTLTLDGNGGYFNEFSDEMNFKVKGGDFDLTDYFEGYKEIDCKYYKLIGFSETPDGEVKYTPENPKVDVTDDLTLYAVYSDVPESDPIMEEKTLYLTDVDLFHNEEYFQKYGEDKIIYPGAMGYYTMDITNNYGKKITINGLSLEETKTVCFAEGCLNMGYVIKDYNNNYYLGKSGNSTDDSIYELLNHDRVNYYNVGNPSIVLKPGEKTEITLNWRWIELNDKLDTKIGQYAADNKDDTIYSIRVGIHFTVEKDECVK